ncbi:MAG: hypothetical protein V9E82_06510 [Candidatus Nanopelagicales bacterium]
MQIDNTHRDQWLATNADLLLAGKSAMRELLPYVNTNVDASAVRPLIVRLEVAISEVTYSDFDRGGLSAMCARAGGDFRAGLSAMDAGDGPLAGECLSSGLAAYQRALGPLLAADDGHDPPPPRLRRWWWLIVGLILLAVLL